MGQNQGKPETQSPPVVDIEHSSVEPDNEADNKQKNIFMVCKKSEAEKPSVQKPSALKTMPVPILKRSMEYKVATASAPSALPSNAPPLQGPNKVKRLFRRHSSMRVCPDGNNSPTDPSHATAMAPECSSLYGDDPKPSTSNPASPSSIDSKNKFLFNGLLTPVVVTGWGDEADEGFITVTQLYNSMHDGQHCPYMFDPTYMLIIDTRVKEDFLKKHIVTARWVGELNEPMRLEELDAYTMIILYDHKGHSHNIKDSTLRQTLKELQAAGVEPFILVGGFDAFFQEHPYLCTHKVPRCEAERQQLIVPFPSIVLDGALYLGRGDQATCNHIVTHLRITHIVNVTRDHRMAFPRRIRYLHIPLDDDASAHLLPEFPAAVRFIGAAIADGGRVLVHCNLGVSRSSTVVIAFLMYTRRWILRDARQYLKERRPIIHPNNAFYHQLSRFEEMLFGKKYTVIQELTI